MAQGPLLTALIAALVALGPLSTDMYLPAFPAMVRYFDSGVAQVQLTLSVFLFGFAAAQLLYGPLSDRLGRKPVLLAGLAVFVMSSMAVALADSVAAVTALRLLQALGAAAGPVLGRAMVRNLYHPRDAARVLSYIGTAMAVAPALAPILGGYLNVWLDWRAIFLFLAGYGLPAARTLSHRGARPRLAPLHPSLQPGFLRPVRVPLRVAVRDHRVPRVPPGEFRPVVRPGGNRLHERCRG
jgi:DHA1 family bicyclomycin/chloramphenicol resistance-like MFS transporter